MNNPAPQTLQPLHQPSGGRGGPLDIASIMLITQPLDGQYHLPVFYTLVTQALAM
jgi:hypothetical protein